MAGYKPLSQIVSGAESNGVTHPAPTRRSGRAPVVVELLEEALEASLRQQPEIPGWLCYRLAALYRSLGRYDDEVHLLERCRDSQGSEEARTRYDARLSKAKTIAERKRRRESGALASVRASMSRPRPRRGGIDPDEATMEPAGLSQATSDSLARAVAMPAARLDDVLALVCAESHANDIPIESVLASLKNAYASETSAHDSRFDSAMLVLLALYYGGES